MSLGNNPHQIGKAKKLYRVVHKLIEHANARALVVHAADKNVWEAWRALNAKFDPRTTRRPPALLCASSTPAIGR